MNKMTPESRPLEANNRTPLYSLLGGNAISQVGNSITILAGPWFVLQTTGSATKTGIVAAALAIGAVIPAVLGGPIVDRLGFRRASIAADLGSAALIGAVPVLHLAGLLQFWHLVILVFLLSSVNAQGDTARYALVPALAERAGIPIERANGIDRAAVRFGQVGGPLIGGLLIAWMGATNVLFVDVGPSQLPRSSRSWGFLHSSTRALATFNGASVTTAGNSAKDSALSKGPRRSCGWRLSV